MFHKQQNYKYSSQWLAIATYNRQLQLITGNWLLEMAIATYN